MTTFDSFIKYTEELEKNSRNEKFEQQKLEKLESEQPKLESTPESNPEQQEQKTEKQLDQTNPKSKQPDSNSELEQSEQEGQKTELTSKTDPKKQETKDNNEKQQENNNIQQNSNEEQTRTKTEQSKQKDKSRQKDISKEETPTKPESNLEEKIKEVKELFKSSSDNSQNIFQKKEELVEELMKSSNTDVVNDISDNNDTNEKLKESIENKDKVKVRDYINQIHVDTIKKEVENDKNITKDEDKKAKKVEVFEKIEEQSREELKKLKEEIKNKKNKDEVKSMIDQVNSTERLRMVAASYIKGEELNNKDCTNISQGKTWEDISNEYKECINNYDNSIEFDGLIDEIDTDGNRTISFKQNSVELSLNLNREQAEKFDMLELQKYVGKDIGLYAGIISYIANNKEIGIDKDNINNVISITQNDKEIDDKNKKNEIILETFSSPEFNRQLLNNNDNCMSMAVGKEKQLAKEMALGCLGKISHTLEENLKRTVRMGTKVNFKTR